MDNLVLVGVSHRTCPVNVRERLVFAEDRVEPALQTLLKDYSLDEALILSTCNRVEILAHSEQPEFGQQRIASFLSDFHGLPGEDLSRHLYSHKHADAVRHVFRVASSLDSMVVGEPQILAQLKQSFAVALQAGAIGTHLNHLLPRAFFVAKRIRTETRIANASVSVSSVAVELARKIFDNLSGKSILMIGAGKMGELAARNLVESGLGQVLVTNRSRDRGEELARRFGGTFVDYDEFAGWLTKTDIVLVSTGAQSYVLDRNILAPVIRERRFKPLFIIDISVPRNVDPRVNELENIFLYDIDDLQSVIRAHLDERKREAEQAESIVEQEVVQYLRMLSSNSAGPVIAALRRHFETVCLEELHKHRNGMPPEYYEQAEKMLLRVAHRMAHPLISKLKDVDQSPSSRLHNLELLKEVFHLDDES